MLHPAKDKKQPDSKHHHTIDYIADANGIISGVALFPQLFKIIRTQQAGDLSIVTFYIVLLTNIVWFAYGLHRKAMPILFASTLNLSASGAIVALYYMFRA